MGGPGGGAASGRRFPNVRSQIYFLDPDGMRIGWQTAGGGVERVYLPGQLTVPARYNFMQGYIYRLKINDIPGRPGVQLYPTLEVAPSTPATDAYLSFYLGPDAPPYPAVTSVVTASAEEVDPTGGDPAVTLTFSDAPESAMILRSSPREPARIATAALARVTAPVSIILVQKSRPAVSGSLLNKLR